MDGSDHVDDAIDSEEWKAVSRDIGRVGSRENYL